MDVSKLQVPEFAVNTQVHGDAAVVQLCGELDEWTRAAVDDVFHMLRTRDVSQFTIDASGLSFVGVSGVHVLVDLLADNPNCVVAVTGASASYARLLEVTGVGAHLADLQVRS